MSLSASILMGGDRRLEAENYLAGGYGMRLAIQSKVSGWVPLRRVARTWQPSRLKGIQLDREHGIPFLAATQVFDLRPAPRKWLSLDRTDSATERFVSPGMILVTCSGSVGRATLAFAAHKDTLISHDLLRIEAHQSETWGWLYAYFRSEQARAMMLSAQYGHIIKHLEVSHLDALPVPIVKDSLRIEFDRAIHEVLSRRNRGHSLMVEAESLFADAVGLLPREPLKDAGFTLPAASIWSGRRRFEAAYHSPAVRRIRQHFADKELTTTELKHAGFKVWLPSRFKRVPASEGVQFMDSSDLFEVSPDISKRIVDGDFGDPNKGRVKAGWLLLARSGQVYGLNGSLTIATAAHEGKIVSDHVIRLAPAESCSIRVGYVHTALSHPELGRPLMKSLAYGSSIPEIEVTDVEQLGVVRLSAAVESSIADRAENGCRLLAEADILEAQTASKAERLLEKFLAGDQSDFAIAAG